MSRYGLRRDEFTDTDGWPHQLHIREARRMQGDHVMTQRDQTAERRKPDSMGMGGYNIDIREVQWVSCPVSRFPHVADEILQEGFSQCPSSHTRSRTGRYFRAARNARTFWCRPVSPPRTWL